MPHHWNNSPTPDAPLLTLRPHRSLPRRGFAAMIMMAFTLGTMPLYGLLGTVFLWGILPFVLLMVAGLWWGLERSYQDGDILEELSLQDDVLHLSHKPARGATKTWECNIYWVRAELHVSGTPLPYYVTLTGNGRTVEIGSFLSEDERKILFTELKAFLDSANRDRLS